MQVTILLDSGAFFEELKVGRPYQKLEVGYFGSGQNVSDIRVLADGNDAQLKENNLGTGRIEVRHLDSGGNSTGSIEVTDGLAQNILRRMDLYQSNTPDFDRQKFDCVLAFTSGRFCCSMVKERRFVEYDLSTGNKTGKDHTPNKQIAHNVAVHFDLQDGDALELRKDDGTVLFSTTNLPPGTKRVDIDVVADNTTAAKLYRDALDLKAKGHTTCWLPNQGDPPTLGCP